MRRTAFVGVLTAGLLASAWFALQPLADPYRPDGASASPNVAHPIAPSVQEIASSAPSLLAEAPALAGELQQALAGGDACLSEGEALERIIEVTSKAEYATAVAAVQEVSAQEQRCGAVAVALGRSRGAIAQTNVSAPAPTNDRPPANFGSGEPIGGGGGPGYIQN